MSDPDFVHQLPNPGHAARKLGWRGIDFDWILLLTLMAVIVYGLIALYSAVEQDVDILMAQSARMAVGVFVMLAAAQLRPEFYLKWTPALYLLGVALLVAVHFVGVEVNGSRRWLEVPGVVRFQPSELMKVAMPLMIAWYFHDRASAPTFKDLSLCAALITLPLAAIILQPDLGTGILVACGGVVAVLLAGLSLRWLLFGLMGLVVAAPALWLYVLRDYQRWRILTLFDPEKDPLGAGWNIIQSTTALGSGGLFGKGLHNGTQSQLAFLPESDTDFIVAVIGEELGFVGIAALLVLYMVIVARGLYIAGRARRTFARLVAGSLALVFFVYWFVNIAMVAGLLPVVGVPLPLISYGGTSAITLLLGFGIVMSMHNRKAW